MKRALKLFNWILCRSVFVSLFMISVAFAGGYGPSTNANTVQGKAPAVANGLATLDASSKLVQDANTVGGKAPAVANGLATLDASGLVSQISRTANSLAMQNEGSCSNGGIVTVTTSATDICTLDMGTVSVGDRILAMGAASLLKSATSGTTLLVLTKTAGSSAAITFVAGAGSRFYGQANTTVGPMVAGIAQVTGAGSFVIRFYGTSEGSNSTIAIGTGTISAFFLKKQ